MASLVSVETTLEKANLPVKEKKKKKKNHVCVGGSLEIFGNINDDSLGRANKKKNHVRL
jgi:hypothetical protein